MSLHVRADKELTDGIVGRVLEVKGSTWGGRNGDVDGQSNH